MLHLNMIFPIKVDNVKHRVTVKAKAQCVEQNLDYRSEKFYYTWQTISASRRYFFIGNLHSIDPVRFEHCMTIVGAAAGCYVCDQMVGKIIDERGN